MEWNPLHDLMLLREAAYEDPFQLKKGSPDRVEVWSKIARSLNSSAELKFAVKQRSVRERFALLQAKYKEKNRKDEASSGTSTQMSELDRLLEDITEKEKDREESRNAAVAKKEKKLGGLIAIETTYNFPTLLTSIFNLSFFEAQNFKIIGHVPE